MDDGDIAVLPGPVSCSRHAMRSHRRRLHGLPEPGWDPRRADASDRPGECVRARRKGSSFFPCVTLGLVYAWTDNVSRIQRDESPMPVISQQLPDDAPRWYACYTRARAEKRVEQLLLERNIGAYLPTMTRERVWADRRKAVVFPLFPSYVFGRFELHELHHVLSVPGVATVVRVAGRLAPIRDDEIENIRRLAAGLAHTHQPPEHQPFQEGQWVRVTGGPFLGLEGAVIETRSRHRVLAGLRTHRSGHCHRDRWQPHAANSFARPLTPRKTGPPQILRRPRRPVGDLPSLPAALLRRDLHRWLTCVLHILVQPGCPARPQIEQCLLRCRAVILVRIHVERRGLPQELQ
jgi:transcriptional antiterminator RfaH